MPLTIAFLSLASKDSANRRANIILSLAGASIWIIDMLEGGLLLAEYMTNVSMIVAVALIVCYVGKRPKLEA